MTTPSASRAARSRAQVQTHADTLAVMAMTTRADRCPRVPMGSGILHAHRPKYSPETQNLLKVLMAESRLTMRQRSQLNESLRQGGSLPAKPPKAHSSAAPVPAEPPPMFRLGCRRPREAILRSGVYEPEPFVPAHPKVDRQREKHSFQDRMAYGKEMPPTPRRKKRVVRTASRSPEPQPDRFEELMREVDERVTFMKDMDAIGQGAKYHYIIQQEIASKIREMEALDKQRTQELEHLASQLKDSS